MRKVVDRPKLMCNMVVKREVQLRGDCNTLCKRMYKTLRVILFLAAYYLPANVFAQSAPPIHGSLPKIVHPSPQAASIQRFGDYPMNFGSGLPEIRIPVYEVKSGSISLPISFSFHASGCKVNQSLSLLGQDWTIEAGGVLSRNIRDKPDDPYQTFTNKTTSDLEAIINGGASPHSQLESLMNNNDKQYDIFSYNVSSGLGGKFCFKHSGLNGNTLTPKHLISSAAKIEFTTESNPIHKLSSFKVTADDGTIYIFGKSGIYGFNESVASEPVYTSWWLAHIISSNLKDSINFKYVARQQLTSSYSETIISNDQYSSSNLTNGENIVEERLGYRFYYPATTMNPTAATYTTADIEEIHFKEGKVRFETRVQGSLKVLSKLEVVRNDGRIVTSVTPYISNFLGEGGYTYSHFVKVDSLTYNSPVSTLPVYRYQFEYYNNPALGFPNQGNVGSKSQRSKDWAGFFNGNAGPLVPSSSYILNWTGGDRHAHPNYAKQGMLRKITFPTGGSTEFIYEGNQAEQNDVAGVPSDYAPGLRLQQQITYSGTDSIPTYKTYQYQPGRFPIYPFIENFGYKTHILSTFVYHQTGFQAAFRQRVISSELLPDVNGLIGNSIYYSAVTEYDGTVSQNNGKTEYVYSGLTKGYFIPTEPGVPSSFTVNGATCPTDGFFSINSDNTFSPRKIKYNAYVNSELTSKTIFKKDGTGYVKLYSTSTEYWKYNAETIDELLIGKYIDLAGNFDVPDPNECLMISFLPGPPFTQRFFYFDTQKFDIGVRKVKAQSETFFVNGIPSLVKTTTFEYDNPEHLQPTQIITTSSDAKTNVQKIKYPTDYGSLSGTDALTKGVLHLQDKNILNVPIETSNFLRSNEDKLTASKFVAYKPDISLPDKIYSFQPVAPLGGFSGSGVNAGSVEIDSRYEERLLFNGYDPTGNILEQQKSQDVKEVYLWGYKSQYPVASVIGSDYVTVKSFIDQNVLDNPLTADSDMRQELAKIRTGLQATGAMVSTYTYSPLIGLTSETNPRGETVFYEYDDINRLKLIRDKDNSILKQFDYRYALPAHNNPIWQTVSTRCVKDANGDNTGEEEEELRDINPNSPTYNQVQWVLLGETGACPAPVYVVVNYDNCWSDGMDEYCDLYFYFYSDAGLTVPVNVTDLQVNVTFERWDMGQHYVTNMTFNCNGYQSRHDTWRVTGQSYTATHLLAPGNGYKY